MNHKYIAGQLKYPKDFSDLKLHNDMNWVTDMNCNAHNVRVEVALILK